MIASIVVLSLLLYSVFSIFYFWYHISPTKGLYYLRATMIASIVVLSLLLWLIIFTLALSLRHSATSSPFPFISFFPSLFSSLYLLCTSIVYYL